ncbi:NADH-quinone oxidoreductase subunit L [Acidicapsa dinghuensis]|uniref:NADH-quinone oxidoreductase subunit L n=1 Tax=Acidicapsa dinghuensis TaxID=2218256 RepID=A0ABW1EGC7_9BACT|nr:NADH-quinone oxidoreductase subunit L [Acidicapsa dinghuensis]
MTPPMIAGSASLMATWLAQESNGSFSPAFVDGASSTIAHVLWLIPAIPMVAAGLIALLKQPRRAAAAGLAITGLAASLILSIIAFVHVLGVWGSGAATREAVTFNWFDLGATHMQMGWLLDPLAAVMLVMVTFVGLLIFIYSTGYMAEDENFTRFFCFLSLFAGGMLGVIISNSILLLFMCWEIVGLTSYLLIGFWYHKPSAAAAAKKAFLTTRVGDIFFLLGIVWLFAQTGTTLFYNYGSGAIEPNALAALLQQPAAWGLSAATAIGLLIFAGAAGKSGQLPLHVWLPDAMEGPTPVSALIHAATMVAAGVYLVARVYPLMSAGASAGGSTVSLTTVAWVGALTALFGSLVAVAQNDIKRILAYSTVSQLGYMMVGLAVGGVAIGMFHLITHAFFKALLFLGAGSVIHGCHEEQDIRRMGGLRHEMPRTFYAYLAGMLALSGFPLFSGFWSKDAIIGSAFHWPLSKGPFVLLIIGALLTAFYMMRQVGYVFFGPWRGHGHPHESPSVMTVPLSILAVFAIFLGFLGTPAWPWFASFIQGEPLKFEAAWYAEPNLMPLMGLAIVLVLLGLGAGWLLYVRRNVTRPASAPVHHHAQEHGDEPQHEAGDLVDVLEGAAPTVWSWLANRLYFDELYAATVIRWYAMLAWLSDWLDRRVWGGIVAMVAAAFRGLGWTNKTVDSQLIDGAFDKTCEELVTSGGVLAWLQADRSPLYLRVLTVGALVLAGIALVVATATGQVRL